MNFRLATIEDVELLVSLRLAQLADEGGSYKYKIDDKLYEFFTKALANGDLIQVLAYENDEVIATGGIGFYSFPPGYENPTGKKAYISSIYTKKPYRRKGAATAVMNELMKIGKEKNIIKYWLFASKEGKPLYKNFGFDLADDYMDLTLEFYEC